MWTEHNIYPTLADYDLTSDLTDPSYDTIHNSCHYIATQIKNDSIQVDKIVGITRGGLIPATILSQMLSLPMVTISYSSSKGKGDDKNHNNQVLDIKDATNILLIDDLADSGHTLFELSQIYSTNFSKHVYTGVIHYKTNSIIRPDYYAIRVPENTGWIVYPWEKDVL
ncbi:MAG: phosphoribosyltransferase [Nitrososphaeraceae archaeon]